jgi:HlyD family secretion protein
MKKKLFLIFAVTVLCFVGLAIYVYVKNQENSRELILYGNVDVRQVDIGFRVAGKVAELFFQEGDQVAKGSLMARLDRSPYDSQVIQAEANIKSIGASFKNAEKNLKRRQELIGVEGVSQENVEDAQTNVDTLRANLASAEANLAVAKDNLSFTETYAPSDGVILSRIREPGTIVRESDPVYTLSVSSPVWVRAFVDEPHLGEVAFGKEVTVYPGDEKGPFYKGRIGFISPIAEFTPKTVETLSLRTDLVYRLRIYIDHPDSYLKQGMPVTVKIPISCPEEESNSE